MTHAEAVAFLSHASPAPGNWADIGAGTGTFSSALAALIGKGSTVFAIDSDAGAVRALRRLELSSAHADAQIVAVRGDMSNLAAIPELAGALLAGALFANALHFTAVPQRVLAQTAAKLAPDGRMVVIEYERREPNAWVPYPLPFDRLTHAAQAAGIGVPERVARRPSRFHREMYCAVLSGRAGV
jgi:SAM-dependent methyltransferase